MPSPGTPTARRGRDLDVDVVLANDPANQVSGYLVAPGGETMGYGSSYLTTGFTASGVPWSAPRRQLSVYAADPVPGRWTLILDFASPVPATSSPTRSPGGSGSTTCGFDRGGLPNSPSVTLAAGKPVTYRSRCTTGGAAPEDIFLDPRLARSSQLPAAAAGPGATVSCRSRRSASPPEWIVPTMTRSLR